MDREGKIVRTGHWRRALETYPRGRHQAHESLPARGAVWADILLVDSEHGQSQSAIDESAPSAGAVGLLAWARGNRNDFYGKILPKALQIQEKQSGYDAEEAEMERRELERIDKLFTECKGKKWLEGTKAQREAIDALKKAKGFAGNDSGFVDYLRELIEE